VRTAIGWLLFSFVSLASVFTHAAPARDALPRSLTDAQVKTVIRARKGDLARCYRQERWRLGIPTGRIDVFWEVRDTGKVTIVYARTDTLGSPDLRQCVESAITRWVFPRFRAGYVKLTMAFGFAPGVVTFGDAAEDLNPVPNVWGPNAMRALLLRFGSQFVTLGCFAGSRSFLGRVCDAPIARAPRIGVDARYTTDQSTVEVARAIVRFEFDRIDANGFAIGSWPLPPRDVREESGPFDGFAVWPPGALKVELTAVGEEGVHDGVKIRCEQERWSPCKDADRPGPDGGSSRHDREQSWPLLEERWARDVERLIAPTLRQFDSQRRLRLAQTLSVDIDGDGRPETLRNVAVTDVAMRPRKDHGREWYPESPTTFFFIFAEKDGQLIRLPARTRPSDGDDMDGLVLGWTDVDGDGRPEILMETPSYEGLTWQLVRFRDGAFRPVAEFGYNYFGQSDAGD
jgi:hypothetical protein